MFNQFLILDADFKKLLIDSLEETHLPLWFKGGLGILEIEFLTELENTFYMPAEQHEEDFKIFLRGSGLMAGRWMQISSAHLAKDGSRVTFLSLMSKLSATPPEAVIFLKKDNLLQRRLKYIQEKFNLSKFTEIKKGPNKNYFNQKNNSKRNPIDSRLRHEVFKRDNYRCKECGATRDETTLHVDHILPVSQSGTDELVNLQTLCQDCNLAKSNKSWSSQA